MSLPNLSLIVIMVCFWVTFWLVSRFLIAPVGRVLAERKQRIEGAERDWTSKHDEYLSTTGRLEAEFEEAARAATRVRNLHRQRALESRQEALEAARTEADRRLQEALDQLTADTDAARTELAHRARDLAGLFASRLLERQVQL